MSNKGTTSNKAVEIEIGYSAIMYSLGRVLVY
jgi:hypothetical protein